VLAGWFRAHVERVWRIVARLGVPAHSVEDIVQEAFITASRRRSDIQTGHEGSFLVGAAIRLSANYRRKAHVRRELGDARAFEAESSPLPDAEQLLIAKRSRELLDRLLGELPEPQREVFVLYELEGLSVPEIADALALPLGTVSSRVWRARARFSELARDLRGQRETWGEP
jgi:RNA polymerase sigma-70 factor (ECF subfamily)